MPSSYTSSLRLELMATGENNSTWGAKNNVSLQLIEEAISGVASIAMADATYTLSTSSAASDQARNAILSVTGALTASRNIIIPSQSKAYLVRNATTGGFAVNIKTSSGASAVVPNGSVLLVFCDGTNTYATVDTGLIDAVAASLAAKAPIASPTFTGTVSGITKGMVGLGNVDNTADASKPVSTAQQSALNLKANAADPAFTGTVHVSTNWTITEVGGALVFSSGGVGKIKLSSDGLISTVGDISTAETSV